MFAFAYTDTTALWCTQATPNQQSAYGIGPTRRQKTWGFKANTVVVLKHDSQKLLLIFHRITLRWADESLEKERTGENEREPEIASLPLPHAVPFVFSFSTHIAHQRDSLILRRSNEAGNAQEAHTGVKLLMRRCRGSRTREWASRRGTPADCTSVCVWICSCLFAWGRWDSTRERRKIEILMKTQVEVERMHAFCEPHKSRRSLNSHARIISCRAHFPL